MIQERIPENFQRLYWLSSRFIIIAVAVGGSYILLYFHTALQISQRLAATGIIASGILTFALISVYRYIGVTQSEQRDLQEEVTKIQGQQKDIMSNQEAWLRAQSQPLVSIDRWHPDADELIFYMLNLGMGGAKELRCKLLIYPPEESDIPLEEVLLMGHLRDESNARAISRTEDPKKYSGLPRLENDFFSESGPFRSLSQKLVGHEVVYEVVVSFEDLSGETDEIKVVTAQSEIDDEEMRVEGLILNTADVYSIGDDVGSLDLEGVDFENF